MAGNQPASVSLIKLVVILSVGLICASLGSIFVRLSQEAPSLSIAFYRMLWASLFLSPFFWLKRPHARSMTWPYQLLVGIALALHFAFWIDSLRFTSVAVSVLLVNTAPAIVAALSFLMWGERLTYRGSLGIFLSICGIVILVGQDLYRIDSWKGALLALLGAVMFAVYLLIGRSCRQRNPLLEYVYPTYVTAAAILLILVFAGNVPLQGFSKRTHLFMILLGVLPQCLGHTSYNWALCYLSATVVSVLMLAEPFLATLFAWWMLGEKLTLVVVVGAAFVAAGIFAVSKWGIQPDKDPD